ncbi:MAG: AAA family ATPase [Polyangiaceae bacterium]
MTESRGAALEPGAHVGRYVVLERIGRGRVFECFRARAFGVEGFEKDVALKIPLPDLAADAERLRALLAAIKVSTTLSHANVVQVIDLGESPEGVPFFVSELARGRPLSRLTGLDAGAGVPLGGALAIAVEIAKALDHGERRKPTAIRHGALDLAQVFVTSDAIVKVSDFGVAAAVGLGGAATSDLAALARMIRELAPVSSQGAAPLLDALEGGALADAAAAHEALLERWFETPPEERDLAGWLASHEHVASDATTATATTMATATAATATEPTPTPAPAITEPSVEPSRREPPPPRDSSSAAGFKFVGRAVELRDLGQVLAAAARNGMSRLTLHGPPGVGKTRLTREFVRRVRDHALTAFVSCAAPGAEQPLGALARTLATLLGLDALQPNGALAAADPDRWVVALRALGLDLDEVRAVAGAAGVRVEAIGPRGRPPSLHEAVIHVLESARLGRPILLAYDDADLLDPVTASVLDALATSERARSLPVLLLQVSAAAPPAEQPAFAVGELDDDDVAQLLAARLGARVLEPRLFDGLVERCGDTRPISRARCAPCSIARRSSSPRGSRISRPPASSKTSRCPSALRRSPRSTPRRSPCSLRRRSSPRGLRATRSLASQRSTRMRPRTQQRRSSRRASRASTPREISSRPRSIAAPRSRLSAPMQPRRSRAAPRASRRSRPATRPASSKRKGESMRRSSSLRAPSPTSTTPRARGLRSTRSRGWQPAAASAHSSRATICPRGSVARWSSSA